MSEHDSPTGYSQKSADGIAETTCPHCGSSQVFQHPVTGEWTCLYCRAHWAATRTAVVSVGDENAPRGADIATGRVFVCPNCGGTQLKQDAYTGKWLCLDCRNEFLDVDARMVVVDAVATIRKNDLVVDTANLLSDAQEADLLAYLRSIESQLVVAVETVNTITENVEYYARRRAQELGVGRDDIDNGVYIVVVLNPRRIQIVTGNGVAPKIDATQLNRISSQIIAPKFKAGDYVAGLKRGVAEMLRLYTSPANSAEASAAKPNGGQKMGRGCLGVVLAAITAIIGGCFGLVYWQARQPYHSYTRISAEGAACFDHYYVYDKQAKTHRLASKTAVPVGNCISERKTSSSCTQAVYTTFESVDWRDVEVSSRTESGDFCSSSSGDSGSSSSDSSSSYGGGDSDSGSSGGSDW
jgi:uncharacterized membrane protein YgcG/predicted RNA-binding Zn-ribbon protein involved in translation (DUF1610 family)